MFLSITPNLCIERTIEIPLFLPGRVHRVTPQNLHVNAGGKGINAARVATQFGVSTHALAWVGKHQRSWFESSLQQEGVAHELIETESDTRVCTNILHGNGKKTEINDAGTPLSIADGTRMLEAFSRYLRQAEITAVCGSYPPCSSTPHPLELHLTILSQMARQAGKKMLVDSKGHAFEVLLRSAHVPWAIKPNCEEASALLRRPLLSPCDEQRALDDLLGLGVEVVILSCGARGAWLGTHTGHWFFTPPAIREVSPVGSGDALVGAFIAQYLQDNDLIESMRWGVAAGAACAAQKLSAFCTRQEIEMLKSEVRIDQC